MSDMLARVRLNFEFHNCPLLAPHLHQFLTNLLFLAKGILPESCRIYSHGNPSWLISPKCASQKSSVSSEITQISIMFVLRCDIASQSSNIQIIVGGTNFRYLCQYDSVKCGTLNSAWIWDYTSTFDGIWVSKRWCRNEKREERNEHRR